MSTSTTSTISTTSFGNKIYTINIPKEDITKCLNNVDYEFNEIINQGMDGIIYSTCIKNNCKFIAKIEHKSNDLIKDRFENLVYKLTSSMKIGPKVELIKTCYINNKFYKLIIMENIKGKVFEKWYSGELDDDKLKLVKKRLKQKLRKLHDNKIIHGDLHGRNIIISKNYEPFIIDYTRSYKSDDGLKFNKEMYDLKGLFYNQFVKKYQSGRIFGNVGGARTKEELQQYNKEYREKNKEHVKEYYEKNKDRIKEYYKKNKDRIKEYSEKNKDRIKAQKKEYREKNKDHIKAQKKEYREKKLAADALMKLSGSGGNVKTLSNQDFNKNGITTSKPGILLIRSNSCGHCVEYLPDYHNFANKINKKNFLVAEIEEGDITENIISVIGEVEYFPKLLLFNSQGKIIGEYTKERESSILLKNINKLIK